MKRVLVPLFNGVGRGAATLVSRLELDEMRFLSSRPNDYPYQGTLYPVVDLVFVAHARHHDAHAVGAAGPPVTWQRAHLLSSPLTSS